MNDTTSFSDKWKQSLKKDKSEEFSTFVPKEKKPVTQRQLFLYQYYTFIKQKYGETVPQKTLEVGCGRGTVSLYFGLHDKAEIFMTDISDSAVELARGNLALHGAKGEAKVAPADDTPYQDHFFDLVFSIGLLEHLDDYQKIVDEKFRVLTPGGVVASLNIPKKSSIQGMNSWYRKILRWFGRGELLKADYYRNWHTPAQFRSAFEKAGFVDVEVTYVTPLPMFTPVWPWLEYFLTLLYRFLLWVRSFFMRHPFQSSEKIAQAHMITARKP